MYKLKTIPEDFIVEEIPDIQINENGIYRYCVLKKKNYNTIKAVADIARALKIPNKNIGFAGIKDKNAITTQYISIKGKKSIELKLKDIELTHHGFGDEQLYPGKLKGNKFILTIRNIDKKPKTKNKFLNLFGEQRFSKNNIEIGKLIIKKQFKEACEILTNKEGDYEKKIMQVLEKNKNNYNMALRQIPKKILKLYVHSYQSYIWNETALELQNKNIELSTIPLVGFDYDLKDKSSEIVRKLLKKDKVKFRDFIVPQIPELTCETSEREMYVESKDLNISNLEKDELNENKKKCTISFELPKSSYATVFIENLFQNTFS